MNEQLRSVIAELEAAPKQGESYTNANGRYGWRNPIRSDTGDLLYAIALANKPRRILEVGTAYGLSGMYLAAGLGQWGRMLSIEFHEEVAKIAQQNFDKAGLPVKVLSGDALAVLPTLAHCYDIVFLDAQKDQYVRYLDAMLKHGLVASGTIVLADNVIDRKEECQAFLDRMKEYEHTIIPTECGLLVARL